MGHHDSRPVMNQIRAPSVHARQAASLPHPVARPSSARGSSRKSSTRRACGGTYCVSSAKRSNSSLRCDMFPVTSGGRGLHRMFPPEMTRHLQRVHSSRDSVVRPRYWHSSAQQSPHRRKLPRSPQAGFNSGINFSTAQALLTNGRPSATSHGSPHAWRQQFRGTPARPQCRAHCRSRSSPHQRMSCTPSAPAAADCGVCASSVCVWRRQERNDFLCAGVVNR